MYKFFNVSKKYGNKINDVIALKSISFSLPKKGLIFITGKSGSGKTTILNLLSFLDNKTSGEIFYNGKSIDNITENEKNNIRSNEIGLVFQEYNLISALNVEENISLSFDICGKKYDRDCVNKSLEDVDLKGLNFRKIHELSGGQKQRVAIARALVKKPNVIICDEPTGALDSKSAEDIFKLLKKISNNVLVVVVSHDFESCKKFADGYIELKDGEIVRNIDNEENENYEWKNYQNNNRLSFKTKLKIIKTNLKKRKFRRIFALVLMTLSIALLSIFGTILSINNANAYYNSFKKNNTNYYSITKYEHSKNSSSEYEIYNTVNMNEKDYEYMVEKYNVEPVIVYDFYNSNYSHLVNRKPKDSDFIRTLLTGFYELDDDSIDKYGLSLLYGQLPKKDNEVCLTDYHVNVFKKLGYCNKEINSGKDLIGEHFTVSKYNDSEYDDFTIVGIVNTMFNFDRYVDIGNNDLLKAEYFQSVDDGIHNSIILNKGFYSKNIKNRFNNDITVEFPKLKISEINLEYIYASSISCTETIENVSSYQLPSNDVIYFSDIEKNDSSCIISYDCYGEINNEVKYYAQELYEREFDKFVTNFDSVNDYCQYLISNDYEDLTYFPISKREFVTKCLSRIESKYSRKQNISIKSDINKVVEQEVNIIGVSLNSSKKNTAFVSENLKKKIFESFGSFVNDYYSFVYPVKNNKTFDILSSQNKKIEENNQKEDYYTYELGSGEYKFCYTYIEDNIQMTKMIIKYMIFILLPITCIAIYYYFSGIILDSRKDIGILRSLGCSKTNICNIFIVEAMLLGGAMLMITFAIQTISYSFINNLLYDTNNSLITMIDFSITPYLLMTIGVFMILFLSTVIPIIKNINKKILDLVNNEE